MKINKMSSGIADDMAVFQNVLALTPFYTNRFPCSSQRSKCKEEILPIMMKRSVFAMQPG